MFEYASDETNSNDGTSGEKQKNAKGGSKGNPRMHMLTILTRRTTLTDHSGWPSGCVESALLQVNALMNQNDALEAQEISKLRTETNNLDQKTVEVFYSCRGRCS